MDEQPKKLKQATDGTQKLGDGEHLSLLNLDFCAQIKVVGKDHVLSELIPNELSLYSCC